MKKPDGGFAFPQGLDHSRAYVGCEGMTLRDHFAAQFAGGFWASRSWIDGADRAAVEQSVELPQMVAAKAYEYADAMLAEREK
jgi:hypothetical protein